MKIKFFWLAAALLLLLAGCQAENLPDSSTSPSQVIGSTQIAAQPSEPPAPSAEPFRVPTFWPSSLLMTSTTPSWWTLGAGWAPC